MFDNQASSIFGKPRSRASSADGDRAARVLRDRRAPRRTPPRQAAKDAPAHLPRSPKVCAHARRRDQGPLRGGARPWAGRRRGPRDGEGARATDLRVHLRHRLNNRDGANGDGRVQRGEGMTMYLSVKNIGKGRSYETQANLRNLSGDGLLLHEGRFDLSNMQPGEVRHAAFTFDVQHSSWPIRKRKLELCRSATRISARSGRKRRSAYPASLWRPRSLPANAPVQREVGPGRRSSRRPDRGRGGVRDACRRGWRRKQVGDRGRLGQSGRSRARPLRVRSFERAGSGGRPRGCRGVRRDDGARAAASSICAAWRS